MPGLDGTGDLFADLIASLPSGLEIVVARYPSDEILSLDELFPRVNSVFPPRPFVIVAESYSSPLAVKIAASKPPNLAGVILCAGFVGNPAGGWSVPAQALTHAAAFRISPPTWALRRFLIGDSPSDGLEKLLRATVARVKPDVLAGRVREVLDCDVREELARAEQPLHYIRGARDGLVGTECFDEIRSIRGDAKLAVIDAPHLVLQWEPEKSAEAILKFLAQIQTSP
jgi:pimeloyl-[acyl-carrier protein] methyl ester esterase